MQRHQSGWVCAVLAMVCCTAARGAPSADVAEKVIHFFHGGNDGSSPYYGGLIADAAGNAYGTTAGGGSGCSDRGGCGTVFKMTKDRKESVLYAFKGGTDGAGPFGALMLDASGIMYGTTASGGGCTALQYGCGTIFKLTPDGTETVLYAFQGGSDGFQPFGSVVIDQAGNLYGTTAGGGTYNAACAEGCGTVFELQPNGTKITLYEFQGGDDGEGPRGALISDTSGTLYGTTAVGGGCSASQFGCGTVFEVTPSGQESILYAFQGGSDGLEPFAGVTMDSTGNLYGTTFGGGTPGCCGVVFEVPAGGGSETVLYGFLGGSDGASPIAGVVRDTKGNLYGTTYWGGGLAAQRRDFGGCGTVFELSKHGHESILYRFDKAGGSGPSAGLLAGAHGKFFGTATAGGKGNHGVVY